MKCKLCSKPIRQLQGCKRKRCNSCNTKIRRYRVKQAVIELLGGRCNRCGWVGHQSVFVFHHPGDDKEFEIGRSANRKWEVVKREVLKCELLCSNCHREEHCDRFDAAFLEEVENYRGRLFQ